MMSILIIIVGTALDFVLALMNGSVFYAMWLWLIVPTLGVEPLTWLAAVMIAVVINFITGKTENIDIELDEFWEYIGMLTWRNVCRCIAFIILTFGLSFIV